MFFLANWSMALNFRGKAHTAGDSGSLFETKNTLKGQFRHDIKILTGFKDLPI